MSHLMYPRSTCFFYLYQCFQFTTSRFSHNQVNETEETNLTLSTNGSNIANKGKKKKPSYFYDPNICVFEIPIDDETECGRKKLASE